MPISAMAFPCRRCRAPSLISPATSYPAGHSGPGITNSGGSPDTPPAGLGQHGPAQVSGCRLLGPGDEYQVDEVLVPRRDRDSPTTADMCLQAGGHLVGDVV